MSEKAMTLAEETKRLADEMTDKACGDFLQASIAAERQALHAAIDRLASKVEADAGRLDWIDTYAEVCLPKAVPFETCGMTIWSCRPGAGELRRAIDSAVAEANASRAEGPIHG